MNANGVTFVFPQYKVRFDILDDKATAIVPEDLTDSELVDEMYDFLQSMSNSNPYKLTEIWKYQNWDDLQDRFRSWHSDRDTQKT